MKINNSRYDRQIKLFGQDGQKDIALASVGILGLGGLGSHLAQQLAYLGIGKLVLVDGDTVEETNLNRLIGASYGDIGRKKVTVAAEMIKRIQPAVKVLEYPHHLKKSDNEDILRSISVIIGGFDDDYPRLITTAIAAKLKIPYIDLATDVVRREESGEVDYGGRVVIAGESKGCLFCLGELDQREIRRAQMSSDELETEMKIYGIPLNLLQSGPSVVTLNGVVASLAATEAMMLLTGLRKPRKLLTYRGNLGVVTSRQSPTSECPYCRQWGFSN